MKMVCGKIFAVACFAALCGLSRAKELTKTSFTDLAGGDHNLFVMFFAPWCPHCVTLKPAWKALVEGVNTDKSLQTVIASVDCTVEGDLCNLEKVQGYPTLKLYRAGDKSGAEYEGPRNLASLSEFLRKQLEIEFTITEEGEEKLPLGDVPGILDDNDVEDEEPHLVEDIAIPDSVNGMHILDEDNYEQFLANGRHFVEFYAPWCGHCQRLAPTWDKLADSFQHDRSVSISKVDCDQFKSACTNFKVKGYPTLLWIVDGKVIEKYAGARTHEDLKAFVVQKVEEEKEVSDIVRNEDLVVFLTENSFDKTINKGVTFVKFQAPWCSHCKRLAPVWDELGQKTMGLSGLRIAKVDCSKSENLCNKYRVDGYPTLLLFKDGQRVAEYEDERTLEMLFDYVTAHVTAVKDEL
jgi:thioredoxin domain-containing protein 5